MTCFYFKENRTQFKYNLTLELKKKRTPKLGQNTTTLIIILSINLVLLFFDTVLRANN